MSLNFSGLISDSIVDLAPWGPSVSNNDEWTNPPPPPKKKKLHKIYLI